MTAEADGLLAAGALLSKEAPDLVDRSNVSLPHLEAFARHAVAEFAPRLKEQPLLPKQLQIFDFSERRQSNLASIVVPAERFGGSKEKRLVVTRVGDALQEPFWPEGLGINRGFLHCLDCADLARGQAALERKRVRKEGGGGGGAAAAAPGSARPTSQRDAASSPAGMASPPPPSPAFPPTPATAARSDAAPSPAFPPTPALPDVSADGSASADAASLASFDAELAKLVQRREDLYNCTKRVSGTTQKSELKPTVDAKRELRYRIDPATRYTHLPPGTDWEPAQTKLRLAQQEKREKQRLEEEAAEVQRRAAAAERLAKLQQELAEKYERELALWLDACAVALALSSQREEECEALQQQVATQQEALELAQATAREKRRQSIARAEELDTQLEKARSVMGRQSFAVRDLENARQSTGGALSEGQTAKLSQAHSKLQTTQAEAERLQRERDLVGSSEVLNDALAEEAEEAMAELKGKLADAEKRREAHKATLIKLKATEPEKPAHMLATSFVDGYSA